MWPDYILHDENHDGLRVEQLSDEVAGHVDVEISWVYGPLTPDLVDVLWHPDAQLLPELGQGAPKLDTDDRNKISHVISVPAGTYLHVGVMPHVLDDATGQVQAQFEGLDGRERYWSEYGTMKRIGTRGRADEDPTELQPPQMEEPELGPGTARLHWTRPAYAEFYKLEFTRGGVGSFVRRPAVPEETLYRTGPDELITARVRGGFENSFGTDRWSDWSRAVEFSIPPEYAYKAHQFVDVGAIAAVRRGGQHTVIIGADGAATSLHSTPEMGWHVWHPISGSPLQSGQPLSAMARSAPFVDAWTVIGDQAHLAWYADGEWRGWGPQGGTAVKFPADGHVGVCTRDANHMDVFAVDDDGIAHTSWWDNPATGWRAFQPLVGAEFPPGAPIGAACRNDDVWEIWAIGVDGVMRGRWWDGQPHDWYELSGPLFPGGSYVAANGAGNTMRVAAVDVDGVVQEIVWTSDDGWEVGWEPRPDVDVDPGQPLAMDAHWLWLVDNQGRVRRWVPADGQWIVDRHADPPFAKPIAATHGTAYVVTTTGSGGELHVGTVNPAQPAQPVDWWHDTDA